jgi:hypothetical protein
MPFQPNLTCLSENPLSELYATLVSVTQKVLHINARSLVYAEKPFAVREKKTQHKDHLSEVRDDHAQKTGC